MRYSLLIFILFFLFISCNKSGVYSPQTCLPAMDSEGGGKGRFISVDGPETPKDVEKERRSIIDSTLEIGDTIYLDQAPLIINRFWHDSEGLKAAIRVEYHDSLVGSHAYNKDSYICW